MQRFRVGGPPDERPSLLPARARFGFFLIPAVFLEASDEARRRREGLVGAGGGLVIGGPSPGDQEK